MLIKCDYFTLLDLLSVGNDLGKYHIVRVIQKDEIFTGVFIPSICSNEIKNKFDEYNKSNSIVDNTQLSQLLQNQQKQQQQQQQLQQLQELLNRQEKVKLLKQHQQLEHQSLEKQEQKFQIEPFKVMNYIEITTRKMKKMVIEVAINNNNSKNGNNNNKSNSIASSPSLKQPKQSVTQSSSSISTTKQSKKGKKTKKNKSKEKESNSSIQYNNNPITVNNSPKKRKENYIQKESEIKRPKINLKIDEENLKDFIINGVLPKYVGNNDLSEKLIIEEVRKKYNTIFLTDDSLKNMVLSILNKLPSNMVKMTICSKCHNKNRDAAKFCDICGNKLID